MRSVLEHTNQVFNKYALCKNVGDNEGQVTKGILIRSYLFGSLTE